MCLPLFDDSVTPVYFGIGCVYQYPMSYLSQTRLLSAVAGDKCGRTPGQQMRVATGERMCCSQSPAPGCSIKTSRKSKAAIIKSIMKSCAVAACSEESHPT